jgi:hypothetical protein
MQGKKKRTNDGGSQERTINGTDRLADFVKETPDGTVVLDAFVCAQFSARISHLQSVARQHGHHTGDALAMINRMWGFKWTTIPWEKFDDCISLMCNYPGDEKYKIFDLRLYEKIKNHDPEKQIYKIPKILLEKENDEKRIINRQLEAIF